MHVQYNQCAINSCLHLRLLVARIFKHASCTLLGIQNGNRKIMISAVNGLYFLKMNYSFGKKEKNGNFVSHQ